MDSLSIPTNAASASAFMSPASLSFPNGNGGVVSNQQLTPPNSDKGKEIMDMKPSGSVADEGAGWQGVSGIVPTLQ
jgi:hypothetical protein